MKMGGSLEKWASGALGVVCVLLVINLVLRSGIKVGATRSGQAAGGSAQSARAGELRPGGEDELARYDPSVHVELLKQLQARPLAKFARSPFEFDLPPAPDRGAETDASTSPAPPPTPPPVPFKALGYSEKLGGVREALLSDDQEIYILHEGETFANKFKVLKISPTMVEIEDESRHEKFQLPQPQ